MTKITYIPGEIANAAIDEHGNRKPVTRTQHIFDDVKGKSQAEINTDVDDTLENHQQQLDNKYNKSEVYTKEDTYSKTQLNNLITTPDVNYINVDATDQTTTVTDVLPATGAANTIYKVGKWDGTQYNTGKYTEYAWNGTSYIPLATRDHGVDDEPTAESDNLVKSGGIYKTINCDIAVDVQQNTLWNNNCKRISAQNYYSTGKISVIEGGVYDIYTSVNPSIMGQAISMWLDVNNKIISLAIPINVTVNEHYESTAPKNAVYLVVSGLSDIKVIMLQKNLSLSLSGSQNYRERYDKDLATEIIIGSYWNLNGEAVQTTYDYVRTGKIEVSPFNKYWIKADISAYIGNAKSLWIDEESNVISEIFTSGQVYEEIVVTAPYNAKYLVVSSVGFQSRKIEVRQFFDFIGQEISETNQKVRMLENPPMPTIVDCWGDSLTAGAGSDGHPYTEELQSLIGSTYSVVNYGHGGETANAIAFRQGGYDILIDPITVPYSPSNPTLITFKSTNGLSLVTLMSNSNGTRGIDYIHIDGKKYMFRTTINANEANLYNFNSGQDLVITRPKLASADGGGVKHILIICMGQNGTGGGSATDNGDILVEMCNNMIKHNNNQLYIVCGPPTLNREAWQSTEKILGVTFGDRFLNLREYISTYGLADNNLTPTAEDEAAMSSGAIPPQLRVDNVHMTQDGYKSMAKAIYLRGQELGYW